MSSGQKLPLTEAWPLLLLFCLQETRGQRFCAPGAKFPQILPATNKTVWGSSREGCQAHFSNGSLSHRLESHPRYSGHGWSVGVDIVGAATGLPLDGVQSQLSLPKAEPLQAGPAPKPDAVYPGAPGLYLPVSLTSVPIDTSRSHQQDGKLTGDHWSLGLTHTAGGHIIQLLPPATLGSVSCSMAASIHPGSETALRPTWPLCLQEGKG